MPESPEVQALADDIGARVAGLVIAEVDVLEFRVVKTRARSPATLEGAAVAAVRRYGKHLDLEIGGAHLGIALGRHGWARWADEERPPDAPPALASIAFDGGPALELTDAGSWVSLGLSVVDRPTDVLAVAKLGPDPLAPSYARDDLDAVLVGRRKQLKAVLQEQESIAGIGNAYSDEILHVARLSPVVTAASLTPEERSRLFDAVTAVLREAAAARRGVPIAAQKAAKTAAMRVHGRAGEPCPVCGGEIRDLAFGGTTAQYCPTCQTDGVAIGA